MTVRHVPTTVIADTTTETAAIDIEAQRPDVRVQQGRAGVQFAIDRPLCGDHLQDLPYHQSPECSYDIPHHRHQYTDGDKCFRVG